MAQGTCDGTSVLGKHDHLSRDPAARPPSDQPRRHQRAERGPTDPQPPRRPVAFRRPQRGVAQPHRVLPDPGGLGSRLFRRVRGRTLQTRHQRRSRRRPEPHVGGGHPGHGAQRGGAGRLPLPTIRCPPTMGPHGGRQSHPSPPAARRSRADHGGPCGRSKCGQPDAPAVAPGQPVRVRATRQASVPVWPSHLAPQ